MSNENILHKVTIQSFNFKFRKQLFCDIKLLNLTYEIIIINKNLLPTIQNKKIIC
jgi:hypothetical protein